MHGLIVRAAALVVWMAFAAPIWALAAEPDPLLKSGGSKPGTPGADLIGVWGAPAINGVLGDFKLTFKTVEDGKALHVLATGGCNAVSAHLTTDGASLSLGPLKSTRRYCGGELARAERIIRMILSRASRYKIVKAQLEFYEADRDTYFVVLTREEQSAPE